jgi:hypothetical protein
MNQQMIETGEQRWLRLVETNREHSRAFREFLAEGIDRVPWMRKGLRSGGVDRATALQVFPYLSVTERLQLFPDLVFLASSAHGSIQAVRHQILSLPRDWVTTTIEQEAESLLREGTYDEYRRFLELYELLDRDLTLKLARRAAAHEDPDIREAGEEYLEKYQQAATNRH